MTWKELFPNATGIIHNQQYNNIFFVSVQIHGFDVIPPTLTWICAVTGLSAHYVRLLRIFCVSVLPLAFKGSEITRGQLNVIIPASLLKGLQGVCVCAHVYACTHRVLYISSCFLVYNSTHQMWTQFNNKQKLQTASLGKSSKTVNHHGS